MTDFIRFWQLVFHMQNHNTTYLCSSQRSLDLFLSFRSNPHILLYRTKKVTESSIYHNCFWHFSLIYPIRFTAWNFWPFFRLSSFYKTSNSSSWAYFVFFQYDFPPLIELSFPFSAFLRRQRPSLLSKFFVNFVVFSGHFFSGSKEDLVVF